jgi:hypothetical protein
MILLVPPEDVSRAMQLFQEAPGVVHVYRMVWAQTSGPIADAIRPFQSRVCIFSSTHVCENKPLFMYTIL